MWFQGRNRHIFLRAQSNFSWFLSQCEMFFPGRKFPFWYTQNKFRSFSKVKSKKKKKKRSSPLFITFPTPISNFPSSLLQFSFFSPQFSPLFPFFLASFFPICKHKFPGQKFLGGTLPPCPLPMPAHVQGGYHRSVSIVCLFWHRLDFLHIFRSRKK